MSIFFGANRMNTNAQPLLGGIHRFLQGNQPDIDMTRGSSSRVIDSRVPPITDEALIARADELFLALDEAEAADAEKT